ncbi:uncharacterized protein PADG_11827 [Paracoccidioides brasiliensis Pb18]|uniref:Uncharacterized protein n=1 Tax=Paracoccidioides brasiliensis (strain Pb18) TaxID=502780 RepID=A0A0A0HVG7_PARBD|nr:uncharacterized protein PADG_11827 [Paracoccidioides brasiliensis Pb18]KGM92036.1 hypothetical protein PADG_11827 [Paracoccidioides brasiliensis Pb18]
MVLIEMWSPVNPVARSSLRPSSITLVAGCQRQLVERRNPLPPTFPPSPNSMSDGFGSNNARQEFVPQAVPHNLDFNCFACRIVPHGSDFNDPGNVNDEMQLFTS